MSCRKVVFSVFTILLTMQPNIGVSENSSSVLECMQTKVIELDESKTIRELRTLCEYELSEASHAAVSVVKDRIEKEKENVLKPFSIMAHRPNYILLGSYNGEGHDADIHNQVFVDDLEFDNLEVQFQLSFKFPLMVNMFNGTTDLFAAYTNRSFWQFYNEEESSPFRETNHEPELWLQVRTDWEILGFTNTINAFGINHQSNGRGGDLSRSWNRIFGWLGFERENLALGIKGWYRIPESTENDDNPDITDYLGHFELMAMYKVDGHLFSVMSRNNLESGFERGAVELSWSFPLFKYPYLKGYVQYFYGYGESLIDYNERGNRIGVGIAVVDWL